MDKWISILTQKAVGFQNGCNKLVIERRMRILIEDFVDAVGSHGCYGRFTDHMKRYEI